MQSRNIWGKFLWSWLMCWPCTKALLALSFCFAPGHQQTGEPPLSFWCCHSVARPYTLQLWFLNFHACFGLHAMYNNGSAYLQDCRESDCNLRVLSCKILHFRVILGVISYVEVRMLRQGDHGLFDPLLACFLKLPNLGFLGDVRMEAFVQVILWFFISRPVR